MNGINKYWVIILGHYIVIYYMYPKKYTIRKLDKGYNFILFYEDKNLYICLN